MPLVYDTQDAVPEELRPFVTEQDGKWHFSPPDVAGLTTALERERAKAGAEETTRKAKEKELDALKRKQDASEKGITEEQLEQLRAEDEKKRKPIEDENSALKSELRKMKLTNRVQEMAIKAGVMPDRIDDAMLALERRTDLTDNGETIVVKDKAGNVTSQKIEDFLATTFKAEKSWLYGGHGGSGGGAEAPSGSGTGGAPSAESRQRTAAEKQAMVRAAF